VLEINLVKREYLKPLIDGATLDLAIYESLNAIWKEYLLLHPRRWDCEKTTKCFKRGL
jgi:hypothetical protein